MSQSSRPPESSQAPQPVIAFFDPKTIKVAPWPRMLVGILAIWCFIGVAMMFFGAALPDTLGAILTVAEALFILARDREGFYTGAGFFKVAEWSVGQRVALVIAEVIAWFLALILYVVRLVALYYQQSQEPAPLTPPVKRKRPQRR